METSINHVRLPPMDVRVLGFDSLTWGPSCQSSSKQQVSNPRSSGPRADDSWPPPFLAASFDAAICPDPKTFGPQSFPESISQNCTVGAHCTGRLRRPAKRGGRSSRESPSPFLHRKEMHWRSKIDKQDFEAPRC